MNGSGQNGIHMNSQDGCQRDLETGLVVLPDGLYMGNTDGEYMYYCRVCDERSVWYGYVSEFDIDNPANVCGRSLRCCP